MTIDSNATLLTHMGQLGLLPPETLAELSHGLPEGRTAPRELARHLVDRGWLTPYQINQLFAGRGSELVLGTYVILERLGEGGMAQVFKARHRMLDRIVALKIVRPDLVKNAEAVRRFRQEVRAAAQMSHPNIVLALDADEVNGTHFMVMEFAEGVDLARMVKREGPLAIRQSCDYVSQVALGLQHAHDKGMVHRDIKPSNLLVTPAAAPKHGTGTTGGHPWGVVKILDMGLARCLHEEPSENTAVTHAGAVIGTPEFLAPEQACNAHDADIRSDLYSLGCTFYYMLTGRPPFTGRSAIETLLQHRLEEARPVEQLRPELPSELGDLIRKLMAKRPEDRFRTPRDLSAAIEPWLASTPPTSRSVGVSPSARTPISRPVISARMTGSRALTAVSDTRAAARRRSLWPTALGALVLLVCLGTFLFLLLRRPTAPLAEKEKPEPVEQRSRLELRRLMERAQQPSADLKQLRQELLAFRTEQAGSDLGRTAADLVSQFPSPLDSLDAKSVPPEASFGGHGGAELVFVQGEVRLRHGSPVQSVALHPDGRTLLSGGDNRHLCIWDLASGKRITAADSGTSIVSAVACSPDGQYAASANLDATVRLWDAAQHRERATLSHPSAVRALAFSADNQFLATGTNGVPAKPGGVIRLWDVKSGKESFTLEGHHGAVLSLAFVPGTSLLASGGDDKSVWLWDLTQRKKIATLKGHQAPVIALAVSSNGQLLASGGHDKSVRLWDVGQKKEQSGPHSFGHTVAGLAFVPKSPVLLVACHDGTLRIWDSSNAQEKAALRGHHGPLTSVAVSANGQQGVTGGHDGSLRRWDLSKQQEQPLPKPGTRFMALALAPEDQQLATGQFGGRIRVWNLPTGKTIDLPDRHQHGIGALAFAPDGKGLLSCGWDNNAILWNLPAGKERFVLQGHQGPLVAGAFAPSGALAATGSRDNTARLWDLATGKEIGPLSGHSQPVTAVAFAADGKTVITGSLDKTLRFWDATTCKEKQSVDFAGEALLPATEKYLAAGGPVSTVRMWDVSVVRPSESKTLSGASVNWVKSLAVAPNGRTLVVAGNDGVVVFWDVTTGRVLSRWSLPAAVNSMTCAGDGRHLVCLLGDGTIAVFRMTPPPSPDVRPHWVE